MNTIEPLLRPVKVWGRSEVLSKPSPVPSRRGIYGWYFPTPPDDRIDTSDCVFHDGMALLYVGISPKAPPQNGKPPSSQTLSTRIKQHYSLNAEGSTLRLTLGCLLADQLGIQLRRVGSGTRMTFTHVGEAKLSEWMEENAFVTWLEADEPWLIEHEALRVLDLPLNLRDSGSSFRPLLTLARADAKKLARQLPILPR